MSNADLVTLKLNIKPLVMLVAKIQGRSKWVEEVNNHDSDSMVATRIIPSSPARSAPKKPTLSTRSYQIHSPKLNSHEREAADGMMDTQIKPTCASKDIPPKKFPSHLSEQDRKLQIANCMTDTQIISESPILKKAMRGRCNSSPKSKDFKYLAADDMTDTQIIPDSPAFLITKKSNVDLLAGYATEPERSPIPEGFRPGIPLPGKDRGAKSGLNVFISPTRSVPRAPRANASHTPIFPKIPAADKT